MKIFPSSSAALRSVQSLRVNRTLRGRETSEVICAAALGCDRVLISDAGRDPALQGREDAGENMPPERIAEARARIWSGAYDSLELVDQVARRVLASGDI